MTKTTKKPTRKPEVFMYRIVNEHGGMQPADRFSYERMLDKNYRKGDLCAITVRKPRALWQHKKAHILGRMVGENIPSFEIFVNKRTGRADGHKVLKRLQIESGVACESMMIMVPNVGMVESRIPITMAFDSMDQGDFEEFYSQICEHVSKVYWPGLTKEKIEEMERLMPD